MRRLWTTISAILALPSTLAQSTHTKAWSSNRWCSTHMHTPVRDVVSAGLAFSINTVMRTCTKKNPKKPTTTSTTKKASSSPLQYTLGWSNDHWFTHYIPLHTQCKLVLTYKEVGCLQQRWRWRVQKPPPHPSSKYITWSFMPCQPLQLYQDNPPLQHTLDWPRDEEYTHQLYITNSAVPAVTVNTAVTDSDSLVGDEVLGVAHALIIDDKLPEVPASIINNRVKESGVFAVAPVLVAGFAWWALVLGRVWIFVDKRLS